LSPSIAVLVPCLNEEITVAEVVTSFRAALPLAQVYVFDNGSTDRTAERAEAAGATVVVQRQPGKGNTMRRAFADVDADVYVMVDGDATYDATVAPAMVQRVLTDKADMVVATRVHDDPAAFRSGHVIGNRLLRGTVAWLFSADPGDLLSGYRALSRRAVKSFPARSAGFEVETELSVHVLRLRAPTEFVTSRYRARPEGSASKLNTYRDGFRILTMIGRLIVNERPLAVWGALAGLFSLSSLLLGVPVVREYERTGLVGRFPSAFLAGFLMVLAILSVGVGLILQGIRRARIEHLSTAYLAIAAPPSS
jgi:glycosyltransferase involved in cell wall biosynthesis